MSGVLFDLLLKPTKGIPSNKGNAQCMPRTRKRPGSMAEDHKPQTDTKITPGTALARVCLVEAVKKKGAPLSNQRNPDSEPGWDSEIRDQHRGRYIDLAPQSFLYHAEIGGMTYHGVPDIANL